MAEQLIKLDLIDDNPYQDRGVYEDIDSLGRTIAIHDLQEKPKARQVGGRYQLKFGHRRKRSFDWLAKNWKKEQLSDRYNGYTVMPLDVEEISDEEMFDGVVVENVHRADLTVTEKARLLKRYKEMHPKATSEQIGLVFNMNAATVRGMDIFLDLPKPVQEKLDDGTITMGTARTLHSMQRIASEKAIVTTLKKVEKQKGNSLPEEVIENAIEHLPNAVQLWEDGRRDGKPRSSWNGGWLLDMKNFPNKLLAPLTSVDAAIELGIQDDQKALKLVHEYLEYVDADSIGPEHENFDEEFHNACKGQAQKRLEELAEIDPAYKEQLEHLINPPACTACPFYTKMRGNHYCGMKTCHTRKTAAWKSNIIQQASKNLGIAVYAPSDGRYVLLETHVDKHRKLFGQRDPALRLMPKKERYHYQNFQGVDDDVFYVAATGDAIGKLGITGGKTGGGKKSEKEKADMRARKIYRVRRKELMWEYTAVAQGMFETVPESVLKKLNNWQNILVDDSIPEDQKRASDSKGVDYQRRALVWRLIMGMCSHYRRESLAKLLVEFQQLTQLRTPKALSKRAAEWDEEIRTIASTVSTATKKEKK